MKNKKQEKTKKAILKIANLLSSEQSLKWAIVGSCNLLLQGIDITPNDIDIITTEDGIEKIYNNLKKFALGKIEFSHQLKFPSQKADFNIDGIDIEVIGEEKNKGAYVNDRLKIEYIVLKNSKIPVASLKSEKNAYNKLGREERVKLIDQIIQSPC